MDERVPPNLALNAFAFEQFSSPGCRAGRIGMGQEVLIRGRRVVLSLFRDRIELDHRRTVDLALKSLYRLDSLRRGIQTVKEDRLVLREKGLIVLNHSEVEFGNLSIRRVAIGDVDIALCDRLVNKAM